MSRSVILSVGLVSPLGLSAEQTAASTRAGLSAFDETTMMDKNYDPFVMALLPDDVLLGIDSEADSKEPTPYRVNRILKLTRLAADQIRDSVPAKESVHLFVGLTDFEGNLPINQQQLRKLIGTTCFGGLPEANISLFTRGRAAGLLAIDAARKALAANQCSIAIAGGVDSYCDLLLLGTLDMEERINAENTLDGFTPGEGAAFMVLATEGTANRLGLESAGFIEGSATGLESGHMYSEEPYLGDGLAGTISELLENRLPAEDKIPTVFSSMNGENHFAKEWGVAYLRNTEHIDDEFQIEHPADCIGDTGAASGPIMIALAAQGISAGYLSGPALVYASSDRSARAACLVSNMVKEGI